MGIFQDPLRLGQAYTTKGTTELLRLGKDKTAAPDYSQAFRGYEDQRKAAQADAANFRSSMPGLNQMATSQQGEEGRLGLAKKLTDIKRGASSRGLLYSGIKQGADQEAATGLASELSGQAYSTNQALENQAKQMEDQAVDAGLNEQNMKQKANQQAYQTALQRRQENQAGLGSLMGGAGSLFGSILGRG